MSFDLRLVKGKLVLSEGKIVTITDTDKLLQDILKICLTEVGSNPQQPWYGSFISKSIIGSALGSNMLSAIAQSQLQTALENLKELQNKQIQRFERVTAAEQIAAINNVSVVRNQIDPRWFDIRITVTAKSLKPISTSFRVSAI